MNIELDNVQHRTLKGQNEEIEELIQIFVTSTITASSKKE